jgi:hypothetical protein
MKWKYFLHWRHAFTPKDFQMHQQSLDHSYCKRETAWTKFRNSQSVMILVVRLGKLTENSSQNGVQKKVATFSRLPDILFSWLAQSNEGIVINTILIHFQWLFVPVDCGVLYMASTEKRGRYYGEPYVVMIGINTSFMIVLSTDDAFPNFHGVLLAKICA